MAALTFFLVPNWLGQPPEQYLRKPPKRPPGLILPYYNIGCYHAAADGKYGEAIDYYNMALQAEPDNASWADHAPGYNDLGYAYLKEGELSNAVANLETARNHSPAQVRRGVLPIWVALF